MCCNGTLNHRYRIIVIIIMMALITPIAKVIPATITKPISTLSTLLASLNLSLQIF